MANTSTIHIKTDFDCIVYDYGQELGATKADTFCNFVFRKGEHELTFVYTEDESISKTITYKVEDADCDYRLIIKIAETICDKAVEQYDSKNYSCAFTLYSLAAEKGLAKAQNGLGECYRFGNGVEIDSSKAVEWYTKAAEQSYAKAQFKLGLCYHCGDGVEENIAKAVEWYTKAAEQGVTAAQRKLGYCYGYGNGVNKDPTKAVEWYTKAVEQGDKWAQNSLGEFYYQEKDYSKAVEWFTKAAENGIMIATLYLIQCYKKGLGVEKDLAKAAEWNIKLAEQGSSSAQHKVGLLYYYGTGLEQNYSKAVEWFTKAAEQGNKEAQCNLGVCYFNGYGTEKDLTKALEWFTKAAEQGNPNAQFNLGNCYKYGTGVKKDLVKAKEWYTKAAEQGHPDAQFNLGTLCTLSLLYGGTRTAAEWWSKAAEQGHTEAQSRLGQYYLGWKPTKALEWLSKAAEKGDKEAQDKLIICYYELGSCYEKGNGVERNLAKTLKWYTMAADQGHADAIEKLNSCYYLDYGCRFWWKEDLITAITQDKEDFAIAMDWFTKAAKNDNKAVKWQLGYLFNDIGECYEKGEGVEYNPSKAIEYYKKAAEQGNEDAKARLEKINQNKKSTIYYLFFDTETTGLFVDEKQTFDLHHSFIKHDWRFQLMRQPHMVQLSWITTDKDCNIISQHDYIIHPKGFSIPPAATRIHGITTEIAKEKGTPIKEVIEKFMEDVCAANTLVGHNIAFDKRVINTELQRLKLHNEYDIDYADNHYDLHSKESICTMIESVPFCEIPSGNYYHPYKQPKLQELHKKLFGYEFEDAHNSMSDVTATLKCFKEMRKRGLI